MAIGIGSVIGDIDQKVDAYRNNPEALMRLYQQNPQLIDLLALQKLKTEKESAIRDMQMKAQTPNATVKDQREQQVLAMTRNEVAGQVAPGLQMLAQQQQQAQQQGQAPQQQGQAPQKAPQQGPSPGGLPTLPAPNMQNIGMAGGGIVAFDGEDGSLVPDADAEPTSPIERLWRKLAGPSVPTTGDPIADNIIQSAKTAANLTPKQQAELDAFHRKSEEIKGKSGIAGLFANQTDKQLDEANKAADALRATPQITNAPFPPEQAAPIAAPVKPVVAPTTKTDGRNDISPDIALALSLAQPTAKKDTTKIPTEAIKQAPPAVQDEYAKRIAELKAKESDKNDRLISFLLGAAGHSSLAGTLAGGAHAGRARDAQIKQQIMDTQDKITALNLKQQELGIEGRKVDVQALGVDAENARTRQVAQTAVLANDAKLRELAVQAGYDLNKLGAEGLNKFAETITKTILESPMVMSQIQAINKQEADGKMQPTDALAARQSIMNTAMGQAMAARTTSMGGSNPNPFTRPSSTSIRPDNK